MKRKSLFGPLLLIALGLVLLLAQLRPEVSPLRLFANHWPWILVAWGGFRLLEYITALVFRRPVPRELGLGAVLLTILLCLIGSAAHSRQQGGGWHVLRLDRTLSGRGSSLHMFCLKPHLFGPNRGQTEPQPRGCGQGWV